ncbi:MAG TPA: hypothetical protein VIM73_02400 [Polyangiaceae bacterium]
MIFSLRNASKHTLPEPPVLAGLSLCLELSTMLASATPRQCRHLISDALDLALVTYGDEPGRAA